MPSIKFDGMTPIVEAAASLGSSSMAEDGDFTTVAGFVLAQLGHIPEQGDSFECGGWRFVVAKLQGHRIEIVVASPVPE